MQVILSEMAVQELHDAIRYLDIERSGLGAELGEEIERVLLRVGQYPYAGSVERGNVRKCLSHRFPYKLLYSIEEDHIFVIAIAHQHRRPEYWVDRNPG
ncbi:MAG: type II toxin-antitoxin system RelE/ParE family toxin [Candidatus Hydrogenedentes bacterium]|nr:type II toxin-antitoxin system RelE/ParE family toxin [Candidatus Hydrogenedentota bacterium]